MPAYVNLWSARNLAVVLPRPWETYLTQNESVKVSPSLVQRDFFRIISQMGTSAKSPKRRGYSSGRIKGYKKAPRTRHQVIRKQKKNQKFSGFSCLTFRENIIKLPFLSFLSG